MIRVAITRGSIETNLSTVENIREIQAVTVKNKFLKKIVQKRNQTCRISEVNGFSCELYGRGMVVLRV